YTIRSSRRDAIAAACARAKIATGIYYPVALNRMPPYRDCPVAPGGVPVAEASCAEVLSLPIHPYLGGGQLERVAGTVRSVCGATQ
ncbi:MAG: DegT/DnrJ/EryC1/StrS family aminotransferase, partial [Hyphomicrobiales bacterium]